MGKVSTTSIFIQTSKKEETAASVAEERAGIQEQWLPSWAPT
jgi:hypothetical protein